MDTGIPVIDISAFIEGDAAGTRTIAAEINRVCETIGFFMITGHGVSQELIDSTYDAATAFFDLPLDRKMEIAQPDPSISRGYTPLAGESLSNSLGDAAPGDLKEMVDFGPVDVPGGEYYERPEAGNHFHANLWPTEPPHLKEAFTRYYRRINRLSNDLMALFAHALDLPETYFFDKLDKNLSALRIIRYPEQNQGPQAGQLRSGAHTDYGTLTVLYSDEAEGGLQVRTKQGEWLDVRPVPGCFVINIGDAMQVWTNDRWVSTLHRVVNPPPAVASSSRRQSLVFFHQPNYDAIIDTLESCVTLAHPRRYHPITFGEHWTRKWMATKVASDVPA